MPWEVMILFGFLVTLVTILLSRFSDKIGDPKKTNPIVGGLFHVSQTLFTGMLTAYSIVKVLAEHAAVRAASETVSFWKVGRMGGTILGVVVSAFFGTCVFVGVTWLCGHFKANKHPQWIKSGMVAVGIFTLLFIIAGK